MNVGNIETIRSTGTANEPILTTVNGEKFNISLYDVLYVPNMMYNSITVSRVRQNNCGLVIRIAGGDSQRGVLTMENENLRQIRMVAHETDERLYRAFLTARHSSESDVIKNGGTSIWHKRLGHCSDEIM